MLECSCTISRCSSLHVSKVADGRSKLGGYAEVQDVLALLRIVLNPNVSVCIRVRIFFCIFYVCVCMFVFVCACVFMYAGTCIYAVCVSVAISIVVSVYVLYTRTQMFARMSGQRGFSARDQRSKTVCRCKYIAILLQCNARLDSLSSPGEWAPSLWRR